MQEKTIQTKQCRHCNSSFDITDKDLEFYEKISPVFPSISSSPDKGRLGGVLDLWNWKVKYLIPTPTLCPDCREQRRLSFRNEAKLYKRKCDLTWKDMISIFSPDKKNIVYNIQDWWSDKWDALDYGMDFDFNKSFFEQFEKLMNITPVQNSFITIWCENTLYWNHIWEMKNCYLVFASWECENCYYSKAIIEVSNVIDVLDWSKLENCYQLVNTEDCFSTKYAINSNWCTKCEFIYDCRNCSDCFLCYNLSWKKYCILNKRYTKEEYLEKVNDMKNDYYLKWWWFMDEIRGHVINRNLIMVNCESCEWDNLKNCKNCVNSFNIQESQNCKYVANWLTCYDTYDGRWVWASASLWYEVIDSWLSAIQYCFSIITHGCSHCFYNFNCYNSSNIYGCVWLKNKEYCILNKQYTKEEYEKLVPKIIEHMMKPKRHPRLIGIDGESEWWEFFPSSISPFGYNETIAMEYFPIIHPREAGGFNRSTYEPPFPKVEKIIPADKLPKHINDIPDDILNWAIECEVTKKPFRIIKPELEFYRKHDLPIPRRHPDQRHLDRLKLRNPRKLFDRSCDKCGIEIKTTFSPEKTEKVYCEKCYEKEIY